MTRALATLAVAAALTVLGACSSDPDNSLDFGTSTTTSSTPASESSPTTAAPTTTTEPTPTTASTQPPTTTAETPTSTATADVEAQVRADFEAMLSARLTCGNSPELCNFGQASIPGSPADTATRLQVESAIADHVRGIPGHGEFKWRIDNVRLTPNSAIVTTCTFDTAIAYDVGDPDTPDDDVIVNDIQASNVDDWELRLVDGQWGLYTTERLDRLEGGDLCGF